MLKNKKSARQMQTLERDVIGPYGYYTSYGYNGLVNGKYMLFSTENEYIEYITE